MRIVKDNTGRILYTVETRKPKPTILSKIGLALSILFSAIFFYGTLILIILCA